MENFVTCQKRMRAVDGKQEIYLEWPNDTESHKFNYYTQSKTSTMSGLAIASSEIDPLVLTGHPSGRYIAS